MKMEENIIDATDRISELPDFIAHHILSFLVDYPDTLVRMSVVSKHWFAVTASFPILKFRTDTFFNAAAFGYEIYDDRKDFKPEFFKYLAYTVSRFCEENISAQTLYIWTDLIEPTRVDLVNRCLGLILNKGLKVLLIDIGVVKGLPRYRLPNILLSASSLTSLTIRGCDLPSSLMIDVVKFKSLKMLSFERVQIDEEVIKYLTTSCPLLEEFNLERCNGFKRFCVYGHQNLQKVRFIYENEIERIDIEALNLRYLLLENYKKWGAPSMSLDSCKNLTRLHYYGFPSTSFADFLSNHPCLENLVMSPSHCDNLKLSIHSLRRLELDSNCDLEEIDINTPNLLLFHYSASRLISCDRGEGRYACFPAEDAVHPKACMICTKRLDTLWFQKLRRFFDKNNAFKVLMLYLDVNVIDVEELKVVQSPPFELEHVQLEWYFIYKLPNCITAVDAVLWCCRPRSLKLVLKRCLLGFEKRRHVVKYTYEKLLQQEDQGPITIQTVLYISSEPKQLFSDFNLLLEALPRDKEGFTITFIKEEVAQEAG